MPVRTCKRSPLRYPEKGFQTIRLPARRSGASRCQSLPCATTWCRPSQFRLVAFTRHLKEERFQILGFFFLFFLLQLREAPIPPTPISLLGWKQFRSPHGELGWETGTTSSIPGRTYDRQAQAQSITHSPPGPSCPDRDKARWCSCWYKDMYSTPR